MSDTQRDNRLAERIARRSDSPEALRAARDACAMLYRHHAPQLLGFLSGRVPRADLEDVHQAIWERVWQRLPKQFKQGNVRAWIFQIARNYLIDRSRKKSPQLNNELDSLVDDRSVSAERQFEFQQRMDELQDCLDQLDEMTAHVVRARLAGEDYETICEQTGLLPAQAHKLFHLGKQQLQDRVGNSCQ